MDMWLIKTPKYHATTIALFSTAVCTVVVTFLLTWPLRDLHYTLDPRVTLLADTFSCVLWGVVSAAYTAVLWNRETRAKFWA